jgi:hypothetical protein
MTTRQPCRLIACLSVIRDVRLRDTDEADDLHDGDGPRPGRRAFEGEDAGQPNGNPASDCYHGLSCWQSEGVRLIEAIIHSEWNPAPATQQPTPQLFFQTINSYQRTEALKAAIELEAFTAIGEGNSAVPEIAKRCQSSQRGMRILCDYLCIMGYLAKDGGRYRLTRDSTVFLDKRSPAFLGGATEFLLSPMLTDGFKDLATAVRKGGAVISEEAKRYEKTALDHGSPFTWSDRESLEELARPERVAQIEREHELRMERLRARRRPNALRPEESQKEMAVEDDGGGCLICRK